VSSSKPGTRIESVLPEELRPQDHRLEMGLQELARTQSWRSLLPAVKRILTSYLGGGMPEDKGDWLASVSRYYVNVVDPEQQEKIAKKLLEDPMVIEVLRLQRGAVQQ
jgi:hypothetical protein